MKRFLRSLLLGLAAVALTTSTASSRPGPDVSDWDVEGIHNEEGAYTGTARLTLDADGKAQMTATCRTRSGKTFGWTGHGKLKMADLELDLALDRAGLLAAIPGRGPVPGHAMFTCTNEDRTISGYWRAETRRSGSKPRALGGGTETLTLRAGKPIIPPLLPPAAAPRLPHDALAVPLLSQPDDYSCGPSSLQGVMYYYRVWDGDLRKLYAPLGTTAANGSDPDALVEFAKGRGLVAEWRRGPGVTVNDLRRSLRQGDPVILMIMAWRETKTPWKDDETDGHYVVLVGMDNDYVYLMDPSAHYGYGYIPMAEFLDRWHEIDQVGRKLVRFEHGAIFFHGQVAKGVGGLVRVQ